MRDSTTVCLRRALDGDLEARAELLARHRERLRAFVARRLGRRLRARESSQDVVQSVLGDVWARFDRLPRSRRIERSGFLRWVLRTADRKLKSRGRFWSRLRRSVDREDPEAAGRLDQLVAGRLDTPSAHLSAKEELDRVERAFARLPDDWRDVVALVRLSGLSHAEVARRLGRTESATRTLLSRALARLATELERERAGDETSPPPA